MDKERFEKNFKEFTRGQFENFEGWENMLIIGGSVVASLLPIPEKYKNNEFHYFNEVIISFIIL